MKDRICIFIDGENLRKSIEKMFKENFSRHEYLPQKADWLKFITCIIEKTEQAIDYPNNISSYHLRTYWYVIADLAYNKFFLESKFDKDLNLSNKIDYYKKHAQSCFTNSTDLGSIEKKGQQVDKCREHLTSNHQLLQNRLHGWKIIQSKIEFDVPRLQFQRFGYLKTDLDRKIFKGEKGVDVKLATDLILYKENYDTAVIVSGDADYIPAVGAIKNFGKTVITVSFKDKNGSYLPGGARQLTTITDYNVSLDYEEMKEICNF